MEKFVSSWSDGKTLPENYVLSPEKRPGDQLFPKSNFTIPVIDLQTINTPDHANTVQQIMEASQEFGAFQVINHGVPSKLMEDATVTYKEFFNLPIQEKARYCSQDTNKHFILYTSNLSYDQEEVHFWRDSIRQRCTPLQECLSSWPDQPARYREVIGEYATKTSKVGATILEMIAEGLGLEPGYFEKEIDQEVEMNVNHYPACPDPSLTLGVGMHSDRGLITVLMQDNIPGLQLFKDGEWLSVDPIPDVFTITLGHIMKIVSNGKLRSGEHRAVTNTEVARQSAAVFLCPTRDCLIEPAKALIDATNNPQLYRPLGYHEFLASHNAGRQAKLSSDQVLMPFLMKK